MLWVSALNFWSKSINDKLHCRFRHKTHIGEVINFNRAIIGPNYLFSFARWLERKNPDCPIVPIAYDWRLPLNTLLLTLLKKFDRLSVIFGGKIQVIAHSMAGMLVSAMIQLRPDLFHSAIIAVTPFHGTIETIRPLTFGNFPSMFRGRYSERRQFIAPDVYASFESLYFLLPCPFEAENKRLRGLYPPNHDTLFVSNKSPFCGLDWYDAEKWREYGISITANEMRLRYLLKHKRSNHLKILYKLFLSNMYVKHFLSTCLLQALEFRIRFLADIKDIIEFCRLCEQHRPRSHIRWYAYQIARQTLASYSERHKQVPVVAITSKVEPVISAFDYNPTSIHATHAELSALCFEPGDGLISYRSMLTSRLDFKEFVTSHRHLGVWNDFALLEHIFHSFMSQ